MLMQWQWIQSLDPSLLLVDLMVVLIAMLHICRFLMISVLCGLGSAIFLGALTVLS